MSCLVRRHQAACGSAIGQPRAPSATDPQAPGAQLREEHPLVTPRVEGDPPSVTARRWPANDLTQGAEWVGHKKEGVFFHLIFFFFF